MGCSFSSSPSFRTCLKPPDPDGGNLLPLDEPVGRRSRDAQVLGDLGDVHMCVAEAVSIGSRRGRFPVAACGIPEASTKNPEEPKKGGCWCESILRIPTLQERALENTQLYPTISFCCLEMVALRRSPPRACVALVGARRPLRAPRRWARGRGDAALGARGPPGAGAPLRLPGDGRQDVAGRALQGRPGRLRSAHRRVRPLRSRPLAVSCWAGS